MWTQLLLWHLQMQSRLFMFVKLSFFCQFACFCFFFFFLVVIDQQGLVLCRNWVNLCLVQQAIGQTSKTIYSVLLMKRFNFFGWLFLAKNECFDRRINGILTMTACRAQAMGWVWFCCNILSILQHTKCMPHHKFERMIWNSTRGNGRLQMQCIGHKFLFQFTWIFTQNQNKTEQKPKVITQQVGVFCCLGSPCWFCKIWLFFCKSVRNKRFWTFQNLVHMFDIWGFASSNKRLVFFFVVVVCLFVCRSEDPGGHGVQTSSREQGLSCKLNDFFWSFFFVSFSFFLLFCLRQKKQKDNFQKQQIINHNSLCGRDTAGFGFTIID